MLKYAAVALLALACAMAGLAQQHKPLYQNDLQKAIVGKIPEEFLILDGAFTVGEEGTNKFLELPGSPLDSFGLLFGPTEKDNLLAAARFYGTLRGRRFPAFGIGLNGISGYKLQVSPGKSALELYRGDTLKTSIPFAWQSGHWTHLVLQVRKNGSVWNIEGKAWSEGKDEPAQWMISAEDSEDLSAGRAALYASPYAETPIRFDDLVVSRVASR
jgi:hypothetical protein